MDKIVVILLILCLIPCITVAMTGSTDMPKVNIGSTLLRGIDGFPTVNLSSMQAWFDDAKKNYTPDVPVLGDLLRFFLDLVRLVATIPVLIWNGINFIAWLFGLAFVNG